MELVKGGGGGQDPPRIAFPPAGVDGSPEWLQGVSEETGSLYVGPDPRPATGGRPATDVKVSKGKTI